MKPEMFPYVCRSLSVRYDFKTLRLALNRHFFLNSNNHYSVPPLGNRRMTSFKQSIFLEGVQHLVSMKQTAEKLKVYIFSAPFVVTAQTSSKHGF